MVVDNKLLTWKIGVIGFKEIQNQSFRAIDFESVSLIGKISSDR